MQFSQCFDFNPPYSCLCDLVPWPSCVHVPSDPLDNGGATPFDESVMLLTNLPQDQVYYSADSMNHLNLILELCSRHVRCDDMLQATQKPTSSSQP